MSRISNKHKFVINSTIITLRYVRDARVRVDILQYSFIYIFKKYSIDGESLLLIPLRKSLLLSAEWVKLGSSSRCSKSLLAQ
jgi:hypothetical protein